MKNLEIIKNVNNLNKIIQENKEFNRRVSYAITKNFLDLQRAGEPYEVERKKIFNKYKETDVEGNDVLTKDGDTIIAKSKVEDFQKALNELLDIDVEFSAHKVSIDDFPEMIDPQTLYILDFMIE